MDASAPAPNASSPAVPWRKRRHATKNAVIVVALVAAGALSFVRRVLPIMLDRASYTDGARDYANARGEGMRYAVWDAPERLGAGVNGPERESRPTLSPDGRWLAFAVGEEGLNAELYLAEIVRGEPRDPRPIASLNTPADELSPCFGEHALYFASNCSGGAGGFDLYLSPWDGAGFGAVQPLDGGVNTPANEMDPAASAALGSGAFDAVAFASDRAQGGRAGFDLYLAYPPDTASGESNASVVALDTLNSARNEREPSFTRDGHTLFFASDRESSRGGFDLYRSLHEGGTWLPPAPLSGLNGAESERSPAPTADGFALYFSIEPAVASSSSSTEVATPRGDLFRARSLELFRRPPPPLGWYDLALLAALLLLALLASLSKRWQALDIFYKCLLVSLLLHLLLMLWVRTVYPDVKTPAAGERGERGAPAFRVHLAGSRSASSASRERGGALEVARSSAPEAAGPERLDVGNAGDPAGSLVEPSPTRGLERAVSELGSAPGPENAALERGFSADAARSPELADAEPAFERRSGDAPGLEVSLGSVVGAAPGARPERGEPAGGGPERASIAVESAGVGELGAPGAPGAPASSLARRADASVSAGGRFTSAAEAPTRPSTSDAPGVALALPAEQFERQGSGGSGDSAEHGNALPSALSFAPDRTGTGSDSGVGPGAAGSRARGPTRATSDTSSATSSGGDARAPLALARRGQGPGGPEGGGSAQPGPLGAGDVARRGTPDAPEIALETPHEEFVRRGAGGDSGPTGSASPGGESSGQGNGLPAALAFTPSRGGSGTGSGGPERSSFAGPLALGDGPGGRSSAEAPALRPLATSGDDRGPALPDAPARLQDTPYRSRFGTEKEIALKSHGGGEDTERAVAQGLAYLARIQRPEGHWGDEEDFHSKYRHVLVGKTGLALLAFLGAGHTQSSGTRYSDNAARAIDFLLAVQEEASGHFGDSEAYSHGVATYALAEDFALTKDERLRAPLQRAVQEILRNQVRRGDAKLDGGWSYYYPDGAEFDRYPRVSITAWQIMALESARLGGLEVPDQVFDAAKSFLIGSWDPRLRAFRYSHDPERLNSGYATLPGSTPAGLFALSLLGEDVRGERFAAARDFVLRRTPSGFRFDSEEEFVRSAQGNLYFWYYGSLALFRIGGDAWERWNAGLKETLLPSQARDGSWRPIDVYAEYAGDDNEDRSYTTALCVLTLEVYYRYFTPLLQVR